MSRWSWILALALVGTPLWAQAPQAAPTAEEELKVARQAYRRGEYDKAVALLDKFIETNQTNTNAYLDRATVRFRLKNFDGSIADYTKVIEINKDLLSAYGGRGVVYSQKGELAKAEADFTKVIDRLMELKKGDEPSLKQLASAYFQRGSARKFLGKAPEAADDFSYVIAINPSTPAYLERALLLFLTNKYSLALTDWEKASELDSQSAEALAGQAIAHARMGQESDAKTSLEAATILEPRFTQASWVGNTKDKGPGWPRKAVSTLEELVAQSKK